MSKAHIDGTVDVEMLPDEVTIKWGSNQLFIECGNEVSTVELEDNGVVKDSTVQVAPSHSGKMVDSAMGMYEQVSIEYEIE
jgi:hypothetical protein